MTAVRRTRLLLIVLFLTGVALPAAPVVFSAGAPPEANDVDRGPKAFADLEYRLLGPNWGGRATRAAGVPGDPYTFYLATASGGVWKTRDGGRSWSPIFDDQPTSSIGSLAVAPSDPNVIYVGSGEANIRGNVAPGNGIYRSLDAGKTWTHVWKQIGQIGTIAVHPKNPDVAYAAVLGHAFGPNPERGVYRTMDGGRTWQQVLKKDDDTGASDIAIDPANPRTLFAGFWQARRRPWELVSGGPGSGLYVSHDSGDTWTRIEDDGLPKGPWGKVGVAIAPSDSRRVYALIEAEEGGLFRSDDGGESWTKASGYRGLRQRAWYYSTLTVHPANPNEVWFPQVPMLRTIDGGRTIDLVRDVPHGDHHDVWFDPTAPRRMIVAHDGGVALTTDGGETWAWPKLPIGQLYHIAVDNRLPYHVAGTLQDIGTAQGPSDTLRSHGPISTDWYSVGGGEAGHIVSDPSDPNIVYAGEYLGIITRYDHRTREARNISAWPDNPSGWGGEQMRYRFQWTAPIAISPHDPKVVYHASQVLFRTSDGGQSWTAISGDLTRNDKTKQQWSGGPITGDNTGVETYCTIFAVAESPVERGVIWTGSDDGLVHVTRDAGKTWTNVTKAMTGFPEWGTVATIEPSRTDAGTAYVVVDAHRLDDLRPYLFRTTDFGRSWTRLDATLPPDVYLHVVREDPVRRGLLYLGTETGVMVSTDGGGAWQSLRLNMPTVAVHDLQVKGDALVVGTHGRSIWILDDLRAVRQSTPDVLSKPLHLYEPAETIAWRESGGPSEKNAGDNPPRGAVLHYYLEEDFDGELVLEVSDARGTVIRRLKSVLDAFDGSDDFPPDEKDREADLSTKAGVHRAVWDLRHEGARKIANAKIDLGDPKEGPFVVPGIYTLKLIAGRQSATTSVRVMQTRQAIAPAEREAQLTFALQIRDAINRLSATVRGVREVRDQVQSHRDALAQRSEMRELVTAWDAFVGKLDALEGRLHNPTAEVTYDILAMKGGARLYSRLSPLMSAAVNGDGAPTKGMRDVFEALSAELSKGVSEYDALIASELAQLNARSAGAGVGHIVVPRRR